MMMLGLKTRSAKAAPVSPNQVCNISLLDSRCQLHMALQTCTYIDCSIICIPAMFEHHTSGSLETCCRCIVSILDDILVNPVSLRYITNHIVLNLDFHFRFYSKTKPLHGQTSSSRGPWKWQSDEFVRLWWLANTHTHIQIYIYIYIYIVHIVQSTVTEVDPKKRNSHMILMKS